MALTCDRCEFEHTAWIGGVACLGDPSVRPQVMRFIQEHPRWIYRQDQLHDTLDEPLVCRICDPTSGARLTALVDVTSARVRNLSFD